MIAEEDSVARPDALGGRGGGGVDCLEPSLLSASSEDADLWGGPLEPSALGGAPILVLCLLGLVSVAWTAFGAASFTRERNALAAKGNKGGVRNGGRNNDRNGDRTQRPASVEDVRAAPPSTVDGAWATSSPEETAAAAVAAPAVTVATVTAAAAAAAAAGGEQAVPPSVRSENDSTRDDVDDTVCFSDVSSYTMRSSELAPPSEATYRGEPGVAGVAGDGGNAGGVGMFFNGNEWRRGGTGGGGETDGLLGGGGVDAGVFSGAGGGEAGADANGGEVRQARTRRRRCSRDEVEGDADADTVGRREEPGAGVGEEKGEGEGCHDSSRASSSVADLRSLEVAHWEGEPTTTPQPWLDAESETVYKEEHGIVDPSSAATAAGPAAEVKPVGTQPVVDREAGDATEPVAAAAGAVAIVETKNTVSAQAAPRNKAVAAADGQEAEDAAAGGGEEGAGEGRGEEERGLLATVEALISELDRDLDAARVLLPECHHFRKVVGCVSQAVGPGMDAGPRQAMHVTEALREATEYTRTLSSPEAFLVVMAELLADGFEDPTAMLGYCTRRLNRAVSALPEPSSSGSSSSRSSAAAAARSQLRSLAKGPNGGGAAAVATAVGNGTVRLPAAAAAATAVAVPPPDPPTAPSSSSATTMAVTPVPASGAALALSHPAAANGGGGGRRRNSASVASDERRRQDGGGGQENGGPQADGALLPPQGAEATASTAAAAAGPTAAESGAAANGGEVFGGEDDDDAEIDCGTGGANDGGLANGGSPARATQEEEEEEEEEEEQEAGAGPCDTNLRSRMGPAFTNEAAGLNELIRRRGGLRALSDARTVASVLRAAAPRRQNAFHLQPPPQQQQRQARGFFEAEPEEGGGEGVPSLLSTPAEGGVGRGSGAGSGEDGGGDAEEAGGSSTYVSTTCGGFFGTTKSPMIHSPSGRAALPWPSPQDANGVCQKLARRVEARIEAMVPFAFPNPTPPSERRRVRKANCLLFTVTGGRTVDVLSDHNTGGGGRNPLSGGGGGGRGARGQGRSPNLEEQLYAGLGCLLEAAKELLPAAREGGAAVNAVGQTAVLTLKGASALGRATSMADTSLSTIPRMTSMCQHAICAPRLGRKTLDGGTRYEDGVLLVPDCRKLRQEIVRSTCMDPGGSIRPDYVAYAGAPIFVDGAPLGTFCVFSRRTLKDLGWSSNHTAILRGLADAAATEMVRLCRIAEVEDQQRLRHYRREQSSSPQLGPRRLAPRRAARRPSRGVGNGTTSPSRAGGGSSSRSSSATRRYAAATALPSSETPAVAAAAAAARFARSSSFSEGSGARSTAPPEEADYSPPLAAAAAARGRRAPGATIPDEHSDMTPPGRDGVLFLNGLDGRGGRSARRSMSEEGAEEGAGFRPPPVLARRSTGELAPGGQAAAVRAAAAMAAAAASSESPRGGARKRWQRALRKLRLRPRRKSVGGGSDEGDNGSSSSLDVSRRRTAGGYADSQQLPQLLVTGKSSIPNS
eukprot:g12508.t1